MIINGENLVLGRLATVVAKNALQGERIVIVNCEKVVITGTKKAVLKNYRRKVSMGSTRKGPFFPRMPDRFVKRAIRGMLPYKLPKGSAAYKRITCHMGIPEKFKNEKAVTIDSANVAKMNNYQYGSVEKICSELGAKL